MDLQRFFGHIWAHLGADCRPTESGGGEGPQAGQKGERPEMSLPRNSAWAGEEKEKGREGKSQARWPGGDKSPVCPTAPVPAPSPPRRELFPPFPSPVSREIQMFGPSSGVAQPDVSSPPGLGVCVFPGRGDGGLPVPGPPGEGASPLALGGSFSSPHPGGVTLFFGVHFILVNHEKIRDLGLGRVGVTWGIAGGAGGCTGDCPLPAGGLQGGLRGAAGTARAVPGSPSAGLECSIPAGSSQHTK